MKNQLKVLSVAALALGLGFGISMSATTAAPGSSIAVVDVAQVINNNSQVKALKENCPPSRTMEQAQAEVNKLIGEDGKYTISKLLGVGTIAESYLAKDASGKEVCIKILKDGITAEKIKKDEKTFIELIDEGKI